MSSLTHGRRDASPTLAASAVFAVLVLVAAGCSSDPKPSASRPASPAATVGTTKVPPATITADLAAEVAAGKKGKAQTDPSSPLATPKAKSGSYTPAAKAAALTNRILYELYGQQMARFKVKVAAADKTSARSSLCADATTGQAPTGTSCPPLAAYPATYRTFQLSLRERELALGKYLYGRVFDALQRTRSTVLREVCLNLVQVASETVSKQIVKDMKAGQTMVQASASAVQASKASKIEPGCLFVAAAPTGLSKAEKGDVVPLKTQSVFGVAEVTSFRTATKSEFASQPPSSVASVQKLIKAEVDRSIRTGKVTVDKAYGTWDRTQLQVKVPATKQSTTTKAPATTAP